VQAILHDKRHLWIRESFDKKEDSMKIGIYNEPSDSGIGGGEYSVAVLAEALGKEHEVEIIHHRRTLTAGQLSELFGVDLTNVRLRYTAYDWPDNRSNGGNPLGQYREAKSWHSKLSRPYDLFINFGHKVPPFCHARYGILMVLFPIFDRADAWPWKLYQWDNSSVFWKCLRLVYNEWEWRKRLGSYRVKLANSNFTKKWAQFRWGVDCQVLYPPVDNHFDSTDKNDMILSVGRFVASGQKCQREMVNVFSRIAKNGRSGWKFFAVGGLGESLKDRAYFDSVRRRGQGCEVHIKADLQRAELRSLYEHAKIYWHAAGYRLKERLRPEMQEHFGISTVEAMAAGCVPVVINRGGQREIVEHGVSGFLWDTLEELREYTAELIKDDNLRAQMAKEARARSQLFGQKMFVEQFQNILKNFK
jgi:glycosyltransferase involved in cell wall biosynthesis